MSRDFNYLLLYQESDNKRDCQPHIFSPSCIPVNREPFIAVLCIVYEVYVKCRQVINELLPCFFFLYVLYNYPLRKNNSLIVFLN